MVLGLEESCPLLKKPQKLGADTPVLGLKESCPLLRKPWKLGAEGPEQEEGFELQREPQEEQPQLIKRARNTLSSPRPKKPRDSHASKDAAGELQK